MKYEVLSLGCRKGDLECVKMMINKYDCDPKGSCFRTSNGVPVFVYVCVCVCVCARKLGKYLSSVRSAAEPSEGRVTKIDINLEVRDSNQYVICVGLPMWNV